MTSMFQAAQADRARWQRQAAAELAAILDGHGDLPCIAWTVGPAGAVLAGQVNGLAPAARVRETFSAWRAALALEEHYAPSGTSPGRSGPFGAVRLMS